ncbi:MAG TPA: response regulator [Acidobacteriota bacterium]|nr:response regulator [Acidobacteriota bacterium]
MKRDGTPRVLVIDDEQFVRELLQDFFEKMDFAVVTAADGDAGIAACRRERFDAALVDLKMPGKGGIEVLAVITEIDPTLPVIVMTGYPTIDSSIEAIRKGAYDYIIKPFKLQELKELIDRAIKEQTLSREIENLRERLSTVESELRRYRAVHEVPAPHDTALPASPAQVDSLQGARGS